MSAIAEWGTPFSLVSSKGTLLLNDDSGDTLFLLLQEGCEATSQIRATVDPVPQADGQNNHARFTMGYEIQLLISLWEDRETPACDEKAREMAETLMLHVNDMLKEDGRIYWTPTGYGDQRLLDAALVRERTPFSFGPAGDPRMTILWDSPFPYVIDSTQDTIVLADGLPTVITNAGTAEFWPVLIVDGPASSWFFDNNTTGESLIYDSAFPGAIAIAGGQYGEFDFFRNTGFLNGTGADLSPGIDVELSDFFSIDAQTPITVTLTGASGSLLLNNAWA